MKLISTVFAALLLAAGAAHADLGDKDNHVEGVGGHTLNELQKQGKPTAADVKKERDLQKNWDREKDNHLEGVGGHAIHEVKKMPPATKESQARKRKAEKTLDRDKNNHEEGVGGHAIHEVTKGK